MLINTHKIVFNFQITFTPRRQNKLFTKSIIIFSNS